MNAASGESARKKAHKWRTIDRIVQNVAIFNQPRLPGDLLS
jgi:hypothetical protein